MTQRYPENTIMGTVEIINTNAQLLIRSHIVTYGNAADLETTKYIREEIEDLWNEPKAQVRLAGKYYAVRFLITAELKRELMEMEVLQNLDPRNNFFRIEEYSSVHISFVDSIGCNTGYFKKDNLYTGSTTAAHEYGHTIGLEHPDDLDIRGMGTPGIMYPRGTLVDPAFQYEPDKPAGEKGGTMHPIHRRVRSSDIEALRLEKLRYKNGVGILGEFT
ncbi:MAG: peptidase M10, partial [Chitinophagaceae bacterium]|nr:peptidase M10 [Chitinophagaceae bacterium]